MAIKGITGDIMSIISNQNDTEALQEFVNSQSNTLNTESPLALAQVQADLLAKARQKKPVVFEYVMNAEGGTPNWKSVELYINPEKMSISNQKIKNRQVTRGGIFYNMWGDDNWSMQLSGTTGLAGMKGIEQLEEIYHASGTLLRYQSFGPEKIGSTSLSNAGAYQVIDYSDPSDIISKAVQSPNITRLDEIERTINNMLQTVLSPISYQKFLIAIKTIGALKNQFYTADMMSKITNAANQVQNSYNKASMYDQAMAFLTGGFHGVLRGLDPTIISAITHEISPNSSMDSTDIGTTVSYGQRDVSGDLDAIYEVKNFVEDVQTIQQSRNTLAQNPIDPSSISARIASMSVKRAVALKDHLQNLKDFYTRENMIKNNLVNYANDTNNGEFADLWRPRRVIMYFENRAYVGHFDSFNINRDSTAPLIRYELRFTVERILVGQVNE